MIFSSFGIALLGGIFLFRNIPPLAMLPPRQMILASALGLLASCCTLSYYYTSYLGLAVGRAVHGLSSASLQTASMRFVHDSFEAESVEGPMSRVMSAMAIGMLAGPLLGGLAAQILGVESVFLCGAVSCFSSSCFSPYVLMKAVFKFVSRLPSSMTDFCHRLACFITYRSASPSSGSDC